MKKKSVIILPVFALLGVLGMFMRVYEWGTALHMGNDIADVGTPITIALAALTVIVLLVSVLYAVRSIPKGAGGTLRKGKFGTVVGFVAGALIIAGGVMAFFELRYLFGMTVAVLFAALSVFTGIAVITAAGGKINAGMSLISPVCCCAWTLFEYKVFAGEPQLIVFVYPCLAWIAATLSYYYISGYAFDRKSPRKAVVAILMTVFLTLTSILEMESDWAILLRLGLMLGAAAEFSGIVRSANEKEILTAEAVAEEIPDETEEYDKE